MNTKVIKLCLILTNVCVTIICSYIVFNSINESRPIAQIQQFKPADEKPIALITEAIVAINNFNDVNSKITSFYSSNISVKVWENNVKFKVSGTMCYEKPKCFRFKIKTLLGPEMDFGSNNDLFWYWSKRDIHPGLYYASYDNYHKTRLKTPFNPVFMRESLGLDQIDFSDAKITENEKCYVVTWEKVSATNQKVLYSIFLDKLKKRINSIVISDTSGKVLASCEITHEGNLPKKILYDWKEEQRSLVLEFHTPVINKTLSKKLWELPSYQPKFDMSK